MMSSVRAATDGARVDGLRVKAQIHVLLVKMHRYAGRNIGVGDSRAADTSHSEISWPFGNDSVPGKSAG